MKSWPVPELNCRLLPNFQLDDWNAVEAAFAGADGCEMGQGWRAEPEPHFQPASVRLGWRDNRLWVYARLQDRDIFNDATRLNDATYELGDIFEILVRPIAQDAYFEFHVTPENQHLQLRWPDVQAIERYSGKHQSLQPFLFREKVLESQTSVQAELHQWRVLDGVPATVAESPRIHEGDIWSFSFSRYDYARGVAEPVLSSSSPHAVPKFHRQQEWGLLRFIM